MNNHQTNTDTHCTLPWSGAAVDAGGRVVPCCRWMGPHGDLDNAPKIANGLENARNSKFFETVRQSMLDGKRINGCKKCWEEEDFFGPEHQQRWLRLQHNHNIQALSVNGVANMTTTAPTKLRYLETGISNLCNFACVMCNSATSSTIHNITVKGKMPKSFHQNNSVIDSDLSELQYLKFVGGEPMMERKHDELLEKVVALNNNPTSLELEYHTNASIFPSERVTTAWKKVKSVRIIFSLDGVYEKSKLQRPGRYKWQDVEDTVHKYVQLADKVNIIFSSNTVLTALNVGQVIDILEWLYSRIGHKQLGWFNVHKLFNERFKYIDLRNISQEKKTIIRKELTDWAATGHPALDTPLKSVYNETIEALDTPPSGTLTLSRELILEKHFQNDIWKYFKEELKDLEI
jgi:molybdenum cofactor biosynthesis enzyme MoaA